LVASAEPFLSEGFVEPQLAAEFPGLRLAFTFVPAVPLGSSRAVAGRLAALSNRFRGASIVSLRTQPVPHAYRAFFRQIGLDPDTDRIPLERAALARLAQGGFRSEGLLQDALLVALIETGVPVWAIDAEHVQGRLGLRASPGGEALGRGEPAGFVAEGRLVVADARCIHALLFGEVVAPHRVCHRTRSIVLFAVGAPGVPAIHLEEALWQAAQTMIENA
jgi:DNA/RNA-binding domain of Phe-tRNA-synthetase-like protein